MDYKQKLAEAQERMDKLKTKIGETADKSKAALKMKKSEIDSNLAKLDAELDLELDALEADLNAQIEKDLKDVNAAMDLFDKDINNEFESDIAAVEGTVNAAKDNVRMAKERRDSKINSLKLRAQMNVNAAKAKIAEKQASRDKAKQEQRIVDLLDYADNCQKLALALAIDAEMAILEAAAEAADHAEKYGK